jgi:hypothetical protein
MMNAIDLAVQKGADNRNAVWNFFRDNPCHTQSECSKVLGMSAKTVGAHCKAIRGGWRPAGYIVEPERVIQRLASPEAFFVATSKVNPEVDGRMWFAQGILDGMSYQDAIVFGECQAARHPIYGCSPVLRDS